MAYSINNEYTSDVIKSNSNLSFGGGGASADSDALQSDIRQLIYANGIYDRFDMNVYSKFSRIGVIDPYNALLNTREYIFFTKPDLPLQTSLGTLNEGVRDKSALLNDAAVRYKNTMAQLQQGVGVGTPYMTLLSNTVTSTLDVPGISSDVIETGGNILGTKVSYRGTSCRSDVDHDFNLEFEDTKYLDVYMLFKIYDEYEKLKWEGCVDYESCGAKYVNYIKNKILHDQFSVYKIVVADDGYRIVYWAKLTGCYPTSIPRDAFSDMTNGPQKITVGFKANFVRDMDPTILMQLSQLSLSTIGRNVDLGANGTNDMINQYSNNIYNVQKMANGVWTGEPRVNGGWVGCPFVQIATVPDRRHYGMKQEYYLRWLN